MYLLRACDPGAMGKGKKAMNLKRGIARLVLAIVLALIGGALVQPSEASAETMTWRVKSNYGYKVQVAFYSRARHHEWPGGGQAYDLNDSETHEYPLECREGEKVCFGGWVTGNARKYWGVGFNGRRGCGNCCYICGAGDIPRQVLN
jgi:hypothetical protein